MARRAFAAPRTTSHRSRGGRSQLVREIVETFCPRFAPDGEVVYRSAGTGRRAHCDEAGLADLGVLVDPKGRMPDVVAHDRKRDRILLIDTATGRGPIDAQRREGFDKLFAASRANRVFVTAFSTHKAMGKHLEAISWGTEAWVAEAPEHLIHFDGGRLAGPY